MPDDPGSSLAAVFQLSLEGSELPSDASADLISATVHDDVDYPSAFAVTLINWDAKKADMKWSDDDLFSLGKQMEIRMGQVGKVTSLISGEITGLELEVHSARVPQLIVRGYDRGHRLARGRRTMSYTNFKDSDMASQIAGNYGLSAEVESTSETFQYVLQHDQSDAAFLRERARRIGFEVYVRGKSLIFRSCKNEGNSSLVLSQDTGLLEFYPRLSTMQQASKVQVRSWNADEKSAWVGTANSSDENGKMGGDTTGLAATSDAFGEACISTGAHPENSQGDADGAALGRLKDVALSYITAEGTSTGRTDLRAGSVVKIQGMGKRFSGLYYFTSTTHTYTPHLGYRTSFRARRNAA